MTPPFKICFECGCDTYKAMDYDKLQRENASISKRLTEQAAIFGVKKAEAWLRQIKLEDAMKYLQRKTKKQAEVITTLENKLKRLKQQPYEKDREPDEVIVRTYGGQEEKIQ